MLKSWKSHELKEEADMVYKLYDGGDFIDIGAFNGFYSFLLSTKAKDNDNFINCEPNSLVLSELYENLSVLKKIFRNINYSVITHPINNGKEVFIAHDDWGHPCFLDISQFDKKNVEISKKFNSTTVDNLVSSFSLKPKLIKIDTEGAEYDVLEGMQETLKEFKPKIMLEKHPSMLPRNISIETLNKILIDHKYTANVINKNKLAIREVWE